MVSVQSPLFRVSSKLSQADHYLFVYRRFGCLPPIHASFWDLPVFGHWLDQFILIWLLLWSTRERLFTSIRIFTLSSCDHDMGWVRFLLWHGDPDASHQPFDFLYYRHLPNLSLRLQRRFLSPQRLPYAYKANPWRHLHLRAPTTGLFRFGLDWIASSSWPTFFRSWSEDSG